MILAVIARRCAVAPVVMFVVVLIVFTLLRLAPGDPAILLAGDQAQPSDIERLRQHMGLDLPLGQQFLSWCANLLRGDFGSSLFSGLAVTSLIAQRLEPTLLLASLSLLFALIFALPLGALCGWHPGSLLDRIVGSIAILGFALPVFIVGDLLVALCARQLHWLPAQGYQPLSDGLWPCLRHLILPSLALAFTFGALIARTTRAVILETHGAGFVATARAKGQRDGVILFSHALASRWAPVLTVISSSFALMVAGVVVTESIFNLPGLGRLVYDAVLKRDYPVVQALLLLSALSYVVINLVTDVAIILLDPRARLKPIGSG